jgi:hypothetical protein
LPSGSCAVTEDADPSSERHIGDPRFRGVYFLLAGLLPLYVTADLRERLIYYAADTQDHTVSDRFVQLLRARTGDRGG